MNAIALAHRASTLMLALATAAAIAACGSQSADKSGADSEAQATLTLEMPDQGDKLGAAFAAAVAQHSHGSVRIEPGRGYDNQLPANELRLARALAAGRAEIGYLPARAWSAAGIPAFRALLAPFTVTTDEAAQSLASGPIARDVLATLPDSVVGLALVPAQPRRVLADRPPLAPADFDGLRLRIMDDPQSAAALEALGATAVQGLRADETAAALGDGRIDGVESAPLQILPTGYWRNARHLSGYGLFAKFQSIVVSRPTWERLSAEQQEAVRAAAQDTVRSARTAVPAQEASDLRQLCAVGVRITVPTAQQLQDLADAAQPAVAPLAADETATRVLEAIRELRGAGPQPLAAPLPAECTGGQAGPGTREGPATIPKGVYVVKVTTEQFHAAGATWPKFDHDWTVTTRFRDGRWTQTVKPSLPDDCADVPTPSHPACSGTYRVDGDKVTIVWKEAVAPDKPAPERLKWSYFDGVLRFEPIDATEPGELAIYGQPWRKVG